MESTAHHLLTRCPGIRPTQAGYNPPRMRWDLGVFLTEQFGITRNREIRCENGSELRRQREEIAGTAPLEEHYRDKGERMRQHDEHHDPTLNVCDN